MRGVVYYSGGVASYIAAKRAKAAGYDCTLLFTDTRTEDASLYEFVKAGAEHLDLPLVWLDQGMDVWGAFRKAKYIGNTRIDPCSRMLKREPAAKWVKENAPDATLVFGFDWTEDHRVAAVEKHYEQPVYCPLTDPPLLSKCQMIEEVEADGLEPCQLYELGFPHANCGGFCVKTGQAQFAHLLKMRPMVYAYHEEKMEELLAEMPTLKPFIRRTRNGKMDYLTMKEWREYVESGGSYDPLDYGGCNCFFALDEQMELAL